MKKYNVNSEYRTDIGRHNVKEKIAEARQLYQSFLKQYKTRLDFDNPESISEAYEKAKEISIFDKAQEIRETVFGRDMHFYGVVYLWDACVNYCAYCPASVPNRKKAIAEGRAYTLRELSVEQAIEDTLAVMKDGHTHICYLSGSSPGREKLPDKISPYLEALDELGLDEIILNIEPATKEGFEKIRSVVKKTSLQFRVFQETYNRKTYAKMHPKGPKADYDFRRQSQSRALEAGFDNFGLGVLFGLHNRPLEELEDLRKHAEELETKYGKTAARVCLPSANELKNIGVQIPYFLKRGIYTEGRNDIVEAGEYEKFNELIYALARLAMPTINIVSSERDGPAMLRILDKYATCTTLNVHPGVGDNAGIFSSNGYNETHFEQATVFPRDPKTTIEEMKRRGYNPIINLASKDFLYKAQ